MRVQDFLQFFNKTLKGGLLTQTAFLFAGGSQLSPTSLPSRYCFGRPG